MPRPATGIPENEAAAAHFRALKAAKRFTFPRLEQATGIKQAQLKRLFLDQATFTLGDVRKISIALGVDPHVEFVKILTEVDSD
ncbi:MAG: hypothetical protein B5766_08305 [Candidatus Lumbricidophila eiseniae]|uniref:HTH cro/C1-type domain-containing protein n=1 Tax=Candidatus Lumbricidiphila eiseniae TaxID=1969409 RepID=A0A2A6FQ31_9MICO|nr:MAG: hypothetical protein B5766_08305 [Candidatus Lumbricidophila eiseniae]